MTIEAGLYAHLMGTAGIAAIAGSRVYPLKIPQNAALPALAYRLVSNPHEEAHDSDPGLARARFQIDALGRRYTDVVRLREAIRVSVKGLQGMLGTAPVQAVLWLSHWDDYDEDLELYRQSMDIRIWHAVPKAR